MSLASTTGSDGSTPELIEIHAQTPPGPAPGMEVRMSGRVPAIGTNRLLGDVILEAGTTNHLA